jgi:hypothetical protein
MHIVYKNRRVGNMAKCTNFFCSIRLYSTTKNVVEAENHVVGEIFGEKWGKWKMLISKYYQSILLVSGILIIISFIVEIVRSVIGWIM